MMPPDAKRSRGWIVWTALLVLFVIVGATTSIRHGADAMWDLLNYHLYNPFAALHDRYLFDIAPAQLQTYFNPLLDYPFYAAVMTFNDRPRLIAALMGSVQGLNLLAITFIAWHCLGLVSGVGRFSRGCLTLIALAIGGTGGGTVPLIGTTTGDLPVSALVLSALCVFLIGVRDASAHPRKAFLHLLVAGLLAGLAVGAKPTMVTYAVSLAAALVVLPWRFLVQGIFALGLGGAVGAALTGGASALRMTRLFGNPFYPLMNSIFHSPWWLPISFRDDHALPKTAFDWVFYPFEWAQNNGRLIVTEVPFRDIRIALALSLGLLALVAAAFIRLRKGPKAVQVAPGLRALMIFGVVSYAVWLVMFSIYRYFLPIEMLSGVFVVLLLGVLLRQPLWAAVAFLAAVACYRTTIPLEWGHVPFKDHYVETSTPRLAPDTVVIILGEAPVAFFIPFMDDARWISLLNNFIHPGDPDLTNRRLDEIVSEHQGPFMVLKAGATPEQIASILTAHGLSLNDSDCHTLSSNIAFESYQLCGATRTSR